MIRIEQSTDGIRIVFAVIGVIGVLLCAPAVAAIIGGLSGWQPYSWLHPLMLFAIALGAFVAWGLPGPLAHRITRANAVGALIGLPVELPPPRARRAR